MSFDHALQPARECQLKGIMRVARRDGLQRRQMMRNKECRAIESLLELAHEPRRMSRRMPKTLTRRTQLCSAEPPEHLCSSVLRLTHDSAKLVPEFGNTLIEQRFSKRLIAEYSLFAKGLASGFVFQSVTGARPLFICRTLRG